MSTIMRKINILTRSEGVYRTDRMDIPELKGWHHSYILAICNNPGLTQDELARHISVNKSNVARNLTHLEENGYVRREVCKNDRRITNVFPTEKMLKIFPKVKQITLDWNSYLAEDLTENEFEQFTYVLERLTQKAAIYMEGRDDAK